MLVVLLCHRVGWDKGGRSGGCGVGRIDIHPPESRTTFLPSPMDYGIARGIFDDQVVSIKVGCAARVAQLAQAEQVAGERWYDVAQAGLCGR